MAPRKNIRSARNGYSGKNPLTLKRIVCTLMVMSCIVSMFSLLVYFRYKIRDLNIETTVIQNENMMKQNEYRQLRADVEKAREMHNVLGDAKRELGMVKCRDFDVAVVPERIKAKYEKWSGTYDVRVWATSKEKGGFMNLLASLAGILNPAEAAEEESF